MGEKGDGKSGWPVEVVDGEFLTTDHLDSIVPAVRATAFWAAVCLPWVVLLFLFGGLATEHPLAFSVLVTASFLSALLGHDYTQR